MNAGNRLCTCLAAALLFVTGCGDGGSGTGGATSSGGNAGSGGETSSGGGTSAGGETSSGGGTSAGGSGGAGGALPPQPGTIAVSVEGVTGSKGLILLAGLAGAGDTYSCTPIGVDPFSDTQPLHAVNGGNPCALAPEAKVFSPGDYNLFALTIQGGEQVPKRCVTFPVTVDGDTGVTAPPFDQWAVGACF